MARSNGYADPEELPRQSGIDWWGSGMPDRAPVTLLGDVPFPRDVPELWRVSLQGLRLEPIGRQIRGIVEDALAGLRQCLDPEIVLLTGHRHWSAAAHAFYGAPGAVGERRRQAGRLYRAFAPLIAHEPALAAHVDAGRPFEPRLLEVVNGWLDADAPRLTLGGLRRFRALGPAPGYEQLCHYVDIAARLPVDWVPDTAEAWRAFRATVPRLNNTAFTLGLDLQDLLRPVKGRWEAFREALHPAAGYAGADLIAHAFDPVRRCEETLVGPFLKHMMQERGLEDDLHYVFGLPLNRIASRLLYGGRSAVGMARLVERWHQGAHALEAALPRPPLPVGGPPAWPALTAPFAAPGGILLVPLTTESELVDEGAKGVDGGGMAGLDHCVGGFGQRCMRGLSHIVSVRRTLPEGGQERLSTLELTVGKGGQVKLVQHHGRGNGEPAPEAARAVAQYLAAIRDGKIAVAPEAAAWREPSEAGRFDWRDPSNLQAAFDAWSPYLQPGLAATGPQGLKDWLGGEMADFLAPEADRTPWAF